MRSIYKYITISFLLLIAANPVQSQEKKQDSKTHEAKNSPTKTPEVKLPEVKWWNGFFVQTDIASLISSSLTKGVNYSMEGGVQVDLKHKFFPVIELGLGGANKLTVDKIGYKTDALFGRIGVDFNLIKPKVDSKPSKNLFLLGLRLGTTHFNYDITNVLITDNYWGESKIMNYTNQSTTRIWYEIVAGVRVEVFKNIFMGWTVRNKHLIGVDAEGKVAPWFIPGYGKNVASNWGVNYTLGYHF